MITILRRCVANNVWVNTIPWRSRSQHDLAAKSSLAHNFVIWSRILQLFHRNDHHIEMACHAQHLGRYLEGQGHSLTLQQNRVRPITLLFKVGFYNYFTAMITILGWHVSRNIWSLPWRSRSQYDLAAKSACNFVIWSRILQLFDR